METIESRANNLITSLFGKDKISITEIINAGYIEELFECKAFIDDINELLSTNDKDVVFHYSLDEEFKDTLLTRGSKVNRTDESKINVDYLRSLINRIKNKKFDRNSILMLLDLTRFMNIYSTKLSKEDIIYILNNRIYTTVKNLDQASDGDTILDKDQQFDKSLILMKWSKIFGNKMVDMVFSLDILLYRLMRLYSLNDEITKPYMNEISDLIAYTRLAIEVRDNNYKPNSRNINNINNLFINYKKLNNKLLSDAISKDKLHLIHFIQSYDIDYQIEGIDVVNKKDSSSKESSFNRVQNNIFIESYMNSIIPLIERELSEPFNIYQRKHRNILTGYLNIYNDIFNNTPLSRLPLTLREVYRYKDYYRNPDNRLSCSLSTDTSINPHLDRKIGLVLSVDGKDILTSSLGYTSCKNHLDFRNDYVSYAEIVDSLKDSKSTNETVVNINNVKVSKVIVLSNDPDIIKRAERIANNYNVELVRSFEVEIPKKQDEVKKAI